MARTVLAWLWAWIKRPANITGLTLFVVGLPGTQDDVLTWVRWLKEWFAEYIPLLDSVRVDAMIDLLGNKYVSWGAVLLAFALFLYNWYRPFLMRVRTTGIQVVEQALEVDRFIERGSAIVAVAQSRYGESRRNLARDKTGFWDRASSAAMGVYDPKAAEEDRMFKHWCDRVVDAFADDNPGACKTEEGKDKYNRRLLLEWLEEKYSEDVFDKFGAI